MMNKMMKKLAVLFTAAALTMTAVPAVVSANDGSGLEQMDVTMNNCEKTLYTTCAANVRETPSTGSRIIKTLPAGTKVTTTTKTSNGWYGFMTSDPLYGGQTRGYVAGNLLTDNESSDYEGDVVGEGKTYTVHGVDCFLALRNDTCYDDDNIIGKIYEGEQVVSLQPTERKGETYWYVYSPTTGRNGYVNHNYLK